MDETTSQNFGRRLKAFFIVLPIIFAIVLAPPIWKRVSLGFLLFLAGFEAEEFGKAFIENLKWKEDTTRFLNKTSFIVWFIIMAVFLTFFIGYPGELKHFEFNIFTFIGIASFYTIALILFIAFSLGGECDDAGLQKELSQVAILKTCFDLLNFVYVYQQACILDQHLVTCVENNTGFSFLFLWFNAAWWSESGASCVGQAVGKKIFSNGDFSYFVSPKKTWEGFFGQFLGSAAAWGTYVATMKYEVFSDVLPYYLGYEWKGQSWLIFTSFESALGFFCVTALASTIGDLFESLYKRACGKKDSSTLVNVVHGGIQDKWDSLAFCLVVQHIWISYELLGDYKATFLTPIMNN